MRNVHFESKTDVEKVLLREPWMVKLRPFKYEQIVARMFNLKGSMYPFGFYTENTLNI